MIYLDHAGTTPVPRPVADAMYEVLTNQFGNPSSQYPLGREAKQLVEGCRATVAGALGCRPENLHFTSGGTEADNWAIFSSARRMKKRGNHVITTAYEHHAVLNCFAELALEGFEVTYLKPDRQGRITADDLAAALRPDTVLVSCMMVNNEIGTRNDVERLAAEVKRRNSRTIVHVDAVQAWMRVPIKLDNIDTLAVSGHKIHAPKGIGALYLSDRLVQAFQPPYLGGEQEREKRPGTENLPYALGLAAAATRLNKTMKSRDAAVRALNLRLREGLKAFPEVVINSPDNAVPEVLNFSENCIKSETMLAHLAQQQVYVSSASACGRGQPSHTLAAMGRDPLAIDTAIRVSFCADNTPEDVDAFLNAFEDGMKHLQRIKK